MAQQVTNVVAHRPWPLPHGPWIMAQHWHDLLFAHWSLPPTTLRPLVPAALRLDTFADQAWVGVVPFRMSGVRPRGIVAVPWLSSFPELNVRTYVTAADGSKPGVCFWSLDAANPIAVAIARRWFHLPYFNALMSLQRDGDAITYRSRRTHRDAPPAELLMRYRPTGPVFRAQSGSLEHWLTERYCLYTVTNRNRVMRGEIHHPPWPLQPAAAEFEINTMAQAAGIDLPNSAPLLHFAARLDVVAWPPRRVVAE